MSDEAKNDEKKPAAEEGCGCQAPVEKKVEEGCGCQAPVEKKVEEGCGCQAHAEKKEPAGGALPPADFSFLASSLYIQGMMSLGLMPGSLGGEEKTEVKLDRATHTIDTLDVLKEKTAGNLTPEEDSLLEGMLHQLRMAFVEVKDGPTKA
jgi:hypothetical protein